MTMVLQAMNINIDAHQDRQCTNEHGEVFLPLVIENSD